MDITYNGKNYFIQRNEEESDISLYNRLMFISKQNPLTENELKKEIRFSNIWINNKLLGCGYSEKLENIIKKKCLNL
tara:strand:- start:7 stop:237 length:231 start_codon:yes stop_codon:yes gene_type:complete